MPNTKGVPTSPAAIALLAVALASCGREAARPAQSPPPVVPLVVSPHPPATYGLADPACTFGPDLAVSRGQIYAWDGPTVAAREVPFHDTVSGESLRSVAVERTTRGEVFERDCDSSRAPGHACDGDDGRERPWTQTTGPTPLRLCRDGFSYARSSLEAIAATSLYFLQAARDTYDALAVKDGAQQPAPLTLSIMPRFIDNYDHQRDEQGREVRLQRFVTHNLAYFQGSGMIAVFPERIDSPQRVGYFWESAFVLAHEYGHHLDYTRHGTLLREAGLSWDPLRHGYQDLFGDGSATSGRAQLVGALAEGFADLLAYYVVGTSNRSMAYVPDIGVNRDVGQASFASGDEKLMTASRLVQLLGADSGYAGSGLRYGDIHIGGAILAHGIDSAFQVLTRSATPGSASLEGATDAPARYRLALAFMDAAVTELAAVPVDERQPQNLFAPIGRALAATARGHLDRSGLTEERRGIEQRYCGTVQRQFPALANPPFAQGGRCD